MFLTAIFKSLVTISEDGKNYAKKKLLKLCKKNSLSLKNNKSFRSFYFMFSLLISNSNWTEGSSIQGVVERVISKSDEQKRL